MSHETPYRDRLETHGPDGRFVQRRSRRNGVWRVAGSMQRQRLHPWRTPTALSGEGALSNHTKLQVAIDANGNATVVWDWFDGLRFNIMTNRYRR